MRIVVITLFPELVGHVLRFGVLGRAIERGVLAVGEQGLQVVLGPVADQAAGEIRAFLHGASESPPGKAGAERWETGIAALGGADNIVEVVVRDRRVVVTLRDAARVDESALRTDGLRGIARPSPTSVHLLHEDAAALAATL